MRTVTPTYFSISSGQVSPTYDTIDLFPLLILLLSSIMPRVGTVTELPEMVPTPQMLEMHADKGDEPWEIYAWCVRDAISKYSGLPKLDEKLSLKDKLAYESLMNG